MSNWLYILTFFVFIFCMSPSEPNTLSVCLNGVALVLKFDVSGANHLGLGARGLTKYDRFWVHLGYLLEEARFTHNEFTDMLNRRSFEFPGLSIRFLGLEENHNYLLRICKGKIKPCQDGYYQDGHNLSNIQFHNTQFHAIPKLEGHVAKIISNLEMALNDPTMKGMDYIVLARFIADHYSYAGQSNFRARLGSLFEVRDGALYQGFFNINIFLQQLIEELPYEALLVELKDFFKESGGRIMQTVAIPNNRPGYNIRNIDTFRSSHNQRFMSQIVKDYPHSVRQVFTSILKHIKGFYPDKGLERFFNGELIMEAGVYPGPIEERFQAGPSSDCGHILEKINTYINDNLGPGKAKSVQKPALDYNMWSRAQSSTDEMLHMSSCPAALPGEDASVGDMQQDEPNPQGFDFYACADRKAIQEYIELLKQFLVDWQSIKTSVTINERPDTVKYLLSHVNSLFDNETNPLATASVHRLFGSIGKAKKLPGAELDPITSSDETDAQFAIAAGEKPKFRVLMQNPWALQNYTARCRRQCANGRSYTDYPDT